MCRIIHHLNGTLPADIPENLKDFFILTIFLFMQKAIVYESYQEHVSNTVVASDDDQSRDSSVSLENEGEISRNGSVVSRKLLQQLLRKRRKASSDSGQDDIDPDNMHYEELVNLTETVWCRTQRTIIIPHFQTSIYTSIMFSKNKEEKCTVCQENFKFGKQLITLPCSHGYHSKCII
ncbi:hypothetical protein OSB04_026162 [Centaurea solstitialis]|uniref:RING-type domain-containing protein n=1 Tax=Centaurea solstitialis TaxID=347529 RepID=A0AA38SPL2_9ASTR|nr:hypothetical protein OSB04_026162 [Centaurea solstitialis]